MTNLKVNKTTFNALNEYKEGLGLVLMGVADVEEWIDGVVNLWHEQDISLTAAPEQIIISAHQVTTTGGRTDLILLLNDEYLNVGKLAIWRLAFGNCSWLDDYIDNYARQHHNPEEVSI